MSEQPDHLELRKVPENPYSEWDHVQGNAWRQGCDAGMREVVSRMEINMTEFRPKPPGLDYYRIFVGVWNEIKKDLGLAEPAPR